MSVLSKVTSGLSAAWNSVTNPQVVKYTATTGLALLSLASFKKAWNSFNEYRDYKQAQNNPSNNADLLAPRVRSARNITIQRSLIGLFSTGLCVSVLARK